MENIFTAKKMPDKLVANWGAKLPFSAHLKKVILGGCSHCDTSLSAVTKLCVLYFWIINI